jgi:hypothetical protein
MILQSATFQNNYAGGDGGGLVISSPTYEVEMVEVLFVGNEAGLNGGGVSTILYNL